MESFVLCERGSRKCCAKKVEAVEFVELIETICDRWVVSQKWGDTVKLIETLKSRTGALKVAEVAELFGVTPQHIYRMAANGSIPSFRVSGSVRFDPDEVAAWLKEKQVPAAASRRVGSPRVAA